MKRILLAALLLVSPALAGEIVGPEQVAEHRIAEFTAKGEPGAAFLWDVLPIGSADSRVIGERFLVVAPPGNYLVELIEISVKDGHPTAVRVRRPLAIGEAPAPEPGPTPGPTPTPDPVPDAPIPVDGLRVLIVYETENPDLTPQQQIILFGNEVRSYLRAKCTAEPQGAFRIWDQNIDTAGDLPLWQKAMERPRASVPWVLISNGKTGHEGPLPSDTRAFIELVKRYE